MEENRELQELMQRIDRANQQQAKYARLQCIFSAVAAVCCAAVLIVLLMVLPELEAMVTQAETVLANVESVTSQLAQADWEGLVGNLEKVSQQIAEANLDGIAKDVNALVQTSQAGLEGAITKLNSIDLETLNKAIADLANVIEPLAKLSRLF